MRWRAMKLRIGTLRTHVREVAVWRKGSGHDVNPFHIPLRGEADHKSLADKVALIRRTIRTVLRQHLSHEKRRPEAQVTLRLTVDQDGYLSKQYQTDDLRDAVAYVLLLELAKFGQRVRRCANASCRRVFVRQGRQRYCSVICRNRVTFKRWYHRHVSLLGRAGKRPRGAGKAGVMMRLRRTRRKRQIKRKPRQASA